MSNSRLRERYLGTASKAGSASEYKIASQLDAKLFTTIKTSESNKAVTYTSLTTGSSDVTGSVLQGTIVFGRESSKQQATQDINKRMAAWVRK